MTPSETLKALRESKGWTRSQLSYHCEIPANTIYGWESGVRALNNVTAIAKLAAAFGVPITDFLPVEGGGDE